MDEGRQWFYPSRGASLGDVLLDLSGSSLAALVTFAAWNPVSSPAALAGVAGRPGW